MGAIEPSRTCEVTLELRGLEWLRVRVKAGDQVFDQLASPVVAGGQGPVELTIAVLAFFSLETPQSINLDHEGWNSIFRLDWWWRDYKEHGAPESWVRVRADQLLPRVGDEGGKDIDNFNANFDVHVKTDAFRQAIVGALINLIETNGPAEVNRRWGVKYKSDVRMTEHHLALLKDLLVRFEEDEDDVPGDD